MFLGTAMKRGETKPPSAGKVSLSEIPLTALYAWQLDLGTQDLRTQNTGGSQIWTGESHDFDIIGRSCVTLVHVSARVVAKRVVVGSVVRRGQRGRPECLECSARRHRLDAAQPAAGVRQRAAVARRNEIEDR